MVAILIVEDDVAFATMLKTFFEKREFAATSVFSATEALKLIASEKYDAALLVYEQLFDEYDFVFVREYQIATQLAIYVNDKQKAIKYLKEGVLSGWEMKSIKKNKYLDEFRKDKVWKSIESEYPNLNTHYKSALNQKEREHVKKMYSKDQKKAIKALFRLSSKAQNNYAENKFAPHSEKQMAELVKILETYGYPGEKLIGNNYWMSTILSHHNSISTAYNKKDTIYPELRPELMAALKNGQMSPYEFATLDDWYLTSKYDRTAPTYGFLDPPSASNMAETNMLREIIYARPFELFDALVAIEKKTGMNFYMADRWY